MKKGLSRMVANRRGTNPGGGAVRVSPGVYRQPIPRPVAPKQPPMAPPMQAPQGQGMGIGGFMQNQIQQQYNRPPEGQGWEQTAGGGYHNPTMFAKQQQMMAQDPRYQQQGMAIPRPIAGQGGGYASQQMAQDPMQQPSQPQPAPVQGKQWIRG